MHLIGLLGLCSVESEGPNLLCHMCFLALETREKFVNQISLTCCQKGRLCLCTREYQSLSDSSHWLGFDLVLFMRCLVSLGLA